MKVEKIVNNKVEKIKFIEAYLERYRKASKMFNITFQEVQTIWDLFKRFVQRHLNFEQVTEKDHLLLRIFLKCNNALWDDHKYLTKGQISTKYQQLQSEELNDWKDESKKISNMNANWLQFTEDDKTLSRLQYKSKTTDWIDEVMAASQAADLWLNTLKEELKGLINDLNSKNIMRIKIFYQHMKITDPCIEYITLMDDKVIAEITKNDMGIVPRNQQFNTRDDMKILLNSYLSIQKSLPPQLPTIFIQAPSLVTQEVRTSAVITKNSIGVVSPPPQPSSSSTTTFSSSSTPFGNPVLDSTMDFISPSSSSSSSSSSTPFGNPVFYSTMDFISPSSSLLLLDKSCSNNSNFITTYQFHFFGHSKTFAIVMTNLTKSIEREVLNELKDMDLRNRKVVEMVLKLLEFEQQFVNFFEDLENQIPSMKASIVTQRTSSSNPSSEDKRKLSMYALKSTRIKVFNIGTKIIEFFKSVISNNAKDLQAFLENDNRSIEYFSSMEVITKMRSLIYREDQLNVEFFKDPFNFHRLTLKKAIIDNAHHFTSVEYIRNYLHNHGKFPQEVVKCENYVWKVMENYKSSVFKTIHTEPLPNIEPLPQKVYISPHTELESSEVINESSEVIKKVEYDKNDNSESSKPFSPGFTNSISQQPIKRSFTTTTSVGSKHYSLRNSSSSVAKPDLFNSGQQSTRSVNGNNKKRYKKRRISVKSDDEAIIVDQHVDAEKIVYDEEDDDLSSEEPVLFLEENYKPTDEAIINDSLENLFSSRNITKQESFQRGSFVVKKILDIFLKSLSFQQKDVCELMVQTLLDNFGAEAVLSHFNDYSLACIEHQNQLQKPPQLQQEQHYIDGNGTDDKSEQILPQTRRKRSSAFITDNDDHDEFSLSTSVPKIDDQFYPISDASSNLSVAAATGSDAYLDLTDGYSVVSYTGKFSSKILECDNSSRIFLQKLVSFDFSKRNVKSHIILNTCHQKNGIDMHGNKFKLTECLQISILGMLNLILFALRQLFLRTNAPVVGGDFFLIFLGELMNLYDLENLSVDALWQNVERYISLPTSLSSQFKIYDDNRFETVCLMWLQNVYKISNGYVANFVGTIQVKETLTPTEFSDAIRTQLNDLNLRHSDSDCKVDDSMLYASFKYADSPPKGVTQNCPTNKHGFPLIMRLDVAVKPNQVQAVYKLVGVYYRSFSSKKDEIQGSQTMLCISAIDDYGVECKFDWTGLNNVKEPSFAKLPSKFYGIENVDESIKTTTICYKTHLMKCQQHFLAEGLVYILCPSQDNVFGSKEHTARVSSFVHFDVINESNSVQFNMHNLERLITGSWLDDNAINFFAFALQEYFLTPSNICISSLSFEQLTNMKMDKNERFQKLSNQINKQLKNLKSKQDLFSNPDLVIHFPVNIGQYHWIYIYISFKDKMICICDSMGKGESHFALASIILEYLDYEQQTIRSSNNSQCVFAVEDWKVIAKAVPNQFDGVNCGVFVILFMFRMMKDVKSQIFKEFDFNKKFNMIYMDQVRKKLVDIVFRRADLGDLESFT